MEPTLEKLKSLLEGAEVADELHGLVDYDQVLSDAIPDYDMSEFLRTELSQWKESLQGRLLKAMARKGHREIAPFACLLLNDPDLMVQLDAAIALTFIGRKDGLEFIRKIGFEAARRQDVLESLQECISSPLQCEAQALFDEVVRQK
jgi:hypothetical protein